MKRQRMLIENDFGIALKIGAGENCFHKVSGHRDCQTFPDQYLVDPGRPPQNACQKRERVAKHKRVGRTRAKARSDDVERTMARTLITSAVQLRRQRWRVLKKQFDHAHHAGIAALKQRDFDRLQAAIIRERRIIDELQVLIEEARTQVGYKTPSSRR